MRTVCILMYGQAAKAAEEKQPVVVWYFGGGLRWGYPSEMEFVGERLARRGNRSRNS